MSMAEAAFPNPLEINRRAVWIAVLVFVLEMAAFRGLQAGVGEVGKNPFSANRIKGFGALRWKAANDRENYKNENLNLARLPIPPRGQFDYQQL
jgi:hypothetical protein